MQVLLGHEMDEAGVGADAGATAEAAGEGDDATAKGARGGPKRPMKRGLYHAARRGKATILAEKLGLSVSNLVANATIHFGKEHTPLDEMLTPSEAAKDFIDAANELASEAAAGEGDFKAAPLPGELRSVPGALAAARVRSSRAAWSPTWSCVGARAPSSAARAN